MSDDRPHDPGGSDGPGPDQGGAAPLPGSGDQPSYSLEKGESAPDPTYGYGPPSYGDQPSYDQSAYGDQYGASPQPGYGDQGGYPPPGSGAGYGAYGPPAAAGGAYGGTPPPKKKRTGLILALVGGGLVLVLLITIGLVAVLAGGGAKPSETVQAYLQALADGNAEKALEQGEKPSDTSFATSAALKSQQDIAKISAIDVSNGSSFGNSARVSATYKFGEKQADESFSLTKVGGEWKLDDTTYAIDLTSVADVPGLTLLGVEAAGKDKAYVFPGPLVWGSSNEYLTVEERDGDDFTLSPSDGSFSFSSLETGLSDAGEKAVADAVSTFIDDCSKSKDLEPDGCPNREYDYDGVDGTATWTAPDDFSSLEYQTGSPVTEVYVSGSLTWSVTYTSEDYDGTKTTVTDDAVDGSLYGTVDLSKTPPVYSE